MLYSRTSWSGTSFGVVLLTLTYTSVLLYLHSTIAHQPQIHTLNRIREHTISGGAWCSGRDMRSIAQQQWGICAKLVCALLKMWLTRRSPYLTNDYLGASNSTDQITYTITLQEKKGIKHPCISRTPGVYPNLLQMHYPKYNKENETPRLVLYDFLTQTTHKHNTHQPQNYPLQRKSKKKRMIFDLFVCILPYVPFWRDWTILMKWCWKGTVFLNWLTKWMSCIRGVFYNFRTVP
jgi:hypothetical protein